LSSADSPGTESTEHASSSEQEQWATSEFINEEAHSQGSDEVDDVQNTIDLQLELLVGDTGLSKDVAHIIGDESVSRPLGEETKGDQDQEAASVSNGLEHVSPSVALELLLELDRVVNFAIFDLDKLIFHVSFGVALSQDMQCLLALALGNEETRRLWDHPIFYLSQ